MVINELATAWKFFSQRPIEIIALGWFLFCWFGYAYVSDNLVKSSHSLSARMHLYRVQWMTMLLKRDNRILDINIIAALHQSISFFASTSILIIAGLLAVLGTSDAALEIIRQLPFSIKTTKGMWYSKVIVLLSIFVYAFFKHTWALRQLNYASIMLGAMPPANENSEKFMASARRLAMILTLAAKHLNRGLRTYYFGIATLSWFVNPLLFMISSGIVVMVMYRREHKSQIVRLLNLPGEEVETQTTQVHPSPASPLTPERR